MKYAKLIKSLFIVSLVIVVFVGTTAAKKNKSCKWMKDAKVEVSNIENGVIIKITSDNPELVKKIQACDHKWKNWDKSAKCKYKKDSDKCRKCKKKDKNEKKCKYKEDSKTENK